MTPPEPNAEPNADANTGPTAGPTTGTPDGVPAGVPDVSVVVPHLNQPDLLELCLASLAAQTLATQTLPPGRFEVIVVDNGSAVLPEAVVARFPFARLEHEPVPGPGPARNRGIELARAPIIAFLDSDCIADPDWLAALLAAFAAHPEAEILGGAVQIFAAGPRPNVAEAFDLVYGIRQEWTIARHGFAATANLAVRRPLFDTVGRFEGLSISEDMEWGMRAHRLGHPTRFVREAVVRHPARTTMDALRKQWDRHISHHWSMQPKTARGAVTWIARAAAMAASPLAEIPRVLTSDRLEGPRQRLDSFRGVAAMRLYRARRMMGELLDPTSRERSAHWNRS